MNKHYFILSHILKHKIYFLMYFLFHSFCSVKMWNVDFFFTLYFISLHVQFGKKNLINKFNYDSVLVLVGHPLLTTAIN